jgi:hypothetical protein
MYIIQILNANIYINTLKMELIVILRGSEF